MVDLQIPDFCVTELTDDRRFSNESLAIEPYGEWAQVYARELSATEGTFRADFGDNTTLTT